MKKWKLGEVETGRYWQGQGHEWDLVALDREKGVLILGEAKWTSKGPTKEWVTREINTLRAKGIPPISRPNHLKIYYCLFISEKPLRCKEQEDVYLIDAQEVLAAM